MLRVFEDELFGDALYDINFKKNVTNKKPKNLPTNEDVNLLMDKCVSIMQNIDLLDFSNEFINIRSATATYLIMFNARKRKKTIQPIYSIQDSTITTAIDIRKDIVSVINILNPANIPLSHQHVRMHQPF